MEWEVVEWVAVVQDVVKLKRWWNFGFYKMRVGGGGKKFLLFRKKILC